MWEFLTAALSTIHSVAGPYAFGAYALTIAAAVITVWTAWRGARFKNLLESLQKLPPKDRMSVLETEMGGVRLAAGISPEQWVRSRIHRYFLFAFFATCVVIVTIATLAVVSRSSGPLFVGSITIIERQYQQLNNGQSLSGDVKQAIQEALELVAKGQLEKAKDAYLRLPNDARVPAVLNDLGVVQEKLNDRESAREAYQEALKKSPDYEPAKVNLAHFEEPRRASGGVTAPPPSDRENEPNNNFFQPNQILLNASISATIADASDADYFAFRTPSRHRDWIDIEIENDSMTLAPGLWVYNADRKEIVSSNGTAATNVRVSFVAEPDSLYYVCVGTAPYTQTFGPYRLMVRPRKAFDDFEPNEDIFNASLITVDKTIEAGIMDPNDTDFYQFKTAQAAKLVVLLDNRSTTLTPEVTIFDSNRNTVDSNQNGNPSRNLRVPFDATANSIYYVRVRTAPYKSTSGKYALTVRSQ